MDKILVSEKAAHWYYKDGRPCYQVLYADKKRAGEMRNATKTDAYKLDLVPGVTTMLGIVYEPGLEAYKKEQFAIAMSTLPHITGESLEDYVRRADEDAKEAARQAAEEGEQIHDLVIKYATSTDGEAIEIDIEKDIKILQAFDMFQKQYGLAKPRGEVPFACATHGGRIDLLYDAPDIVDIKTVESKPDKLMPFYRKWGYQLGGYWHGIGLQHSPRLLNLIISRNEPGRWEVKDWTSQRDRLLGAWCNALALWQDYNNFPKEG